MEDLDKSHHFLAVGFAVPSDPGGKAIHELTRNSTKYGLASSYFM